MQVIIRPDTVLGKLDRELNGSKSHIGPRKIMYHLKYYKIGLNILLLLRTKSVQQQIISRLALAQTLSHIRTPLFLSLANPSVIIIVAFDII